jgi:hypothetical protein
MALKYESPRDYILARLKEGKNIFDHRLRYFCGHSDEILMYCWKLLDEGIISVDEHWKASLVEDGLEELVI